MSLDSWLAPRNPRLNPKRVKLNDGCREPRLRVPIAASPCLGASAGPNTSMFAPPPRFEPGIDSYDLPPEYMIGTASLYGWKPCSVRSDTEISALHCPEDSDLVVLGHDNGSVSLTRPAKQYQEFVRADTGSNWPVVDVVGLDGGAQILCATKQGTCTVDVRTGLTGKFCEADTAVTRLAVNGRLVAIGGLAGTVQLHDARDMSCTKRLSNAHAVQRGPLASRVNPEIAALAWAGPSVLATASPSNETIKFWDIRNSRKPLMSTWAQTGSDKCAGGIVSMRGDGRGSVWALSRHSKLMKFSAMLPCPEYRLASPALEVSQANQSLDIVPGDWYSSHPLLACSSSLGTVLVTEPSDAASDLRVDATIASKLMIEPLKLANFVKWHPYTHELVSVYESLYTVHWSHTDEPDLQAHPVPVGMTTIGRSQ